MTDKQWTPPKQQGFNFDRLNQQATKETISDMQAALLRTEAHLHDNAPKTKELNPYELDTHDQLGSALGTVASYDTKLLNERNPARDRELLASIEMLQPKPLATAPDESGKKPDRYRAAYDAYAGQDPDIAKGLATLQKLVEEKAQAASQTASAHR